MEPREAVELQTEPGRLKVQGQPKKGDEKEDRSCGREPERVRKEGRGKRQNSVQAWRRTSEGEKNEKLHSKRERKRRSAAG